MKLGELERDGFMTIQYEPDLKAVIDAAMSSWRTFCALPMSEKHLLSKESADKTKDFGYMFRDGRDKKELFHVSGRDHGELCQMAEVTSSEHKEQATAFIGCADRFIKGATSMVETFAKGVETRYRLDGFVHRVMDNADNWVFRFLHYFPGYEMMANPHLDRVNGFTLHLNESVGGVEYLDWQKNWRPFPITGGKTVIFPGAGMEHLSKGMVLALWHRVRALDETRQTSRFAMVAFINAEYGFKFDDRRYNTKNLEPGFNYGNPYHALNQFFVPK